MSASLLQTSVDSSYHDVALDDHVGSNGAMKEVVSVTGPADDSSETQRMTWRNNSSEGCDDHDSSNVEDSSGDKHVELRSKDRRKLGTMGRSVSSFSSLRSESEGRTRSHSVLEAKEFAYNKLKEELKTAQLELKLKDKESEKLQQMENELEELTASLFEEANKMVLDANVKRMHVEKLLAEANSKIDVLEAEVVALKTLVITSTPSMPNRHLHPQLSAAESTGKFVKGHRRSTSHHDILKETSTPQNLCIKTLPEKKTEDIDPVMFKEFQDWRAKPEMHASSTFLQRIYQEDISPCMNFSNEELASSVFDSVRNNILTIELIAGKRSFPRRCALLDTQKLCQYRVRLCDGGIWYFICELARNRIAAVCDFYTYIRYIHQGLVKSDDPSSYREIIRLRKNMALARLGISE